METTETLLDRAIRTATRAHAGQVDKSGEPYIQHPLRVMAAVADAGEEAMMVAVLHDVVEDTKVRLLDLAQMGFPPEVIAGVDALSRRKGEGYRQYLQRCGRDRLGRIVKRADLADNMDPARAFPGSQSLMKRYRDSVVFLDGQRPYGRDDGGR